MNDALQSVIYGAAQFAGMHAVGGAGADVIRWMRGKELYPFASGEPLDVTKIPEPKTFSPDYMPPVLKIIDSLPDSAKEDVMRVAVNNLVEGEPVKVAEVLDAAAKSDPRITDALNLGAKITIDGKEIPAPKEQRDRPTLF